MNKDMNKDMNKEKESKIEITSDIKKFLSLPEVNKIIHHNGSYDLSLLTGDASQRTYYRAYNNSDNSSYVVCRDKSCSDIKTLEQYDFWEVYNFLRKNNIRVPEIFHVDLTNALLLEEDLGEISLLSKMSSIDSLQEEYNLYESCLDLLIKIHSQKLTSLDGPATGAHRFANRYFDRQKYEYEIDFTKTHFLERFLNVKFTEMETEIFNSAFSKIISVLTKQKNYFTHRDFHSRNIMVKNDELVIIDFQDARMGPLQYDLVSLLDDCYYSIDEENHKQLIKYYWHNWAQEECDSSFDEFMEVYCYMAVQRIYKAIGSFAYIYYNKNSPKYLVNIGRAMERLKYFLINSDDFELNKELISIKQILFKYYYGNYGN
ncbi:MAG: phosphotransferase [Oligoflexia bacterium]|nr:phosphotransferase [Oligoflexia bacterium]